MTRRNKILATVAVILLFAIFPMTTTPSSAFTSAPTCLYGSASHGGQLSPDSGIVIEDQTVIFNLNNFPELDNEDMVPNQVGSVYTSYSLYNPTDSEITFTIALPLSSIPENYTNNRYDADILDYSIKANNLPVESALRHGMAFGKRVDEVGFISFIADEYISNQYCSPNTTVTKYTFLQSNTEYSSSSPVAFDINPKMFKGNCFYLDGGFNISYQDDGDCRFYTLGQDGHTYDLYVFGDDIPYIPSWNIYDLGTIRDGHEIDGKIELITTETMTFSEFVSSYYNESLGINELDWYNMAAKEISLAMEKGEVFTHFDSLNTKDGNNIANGFVYKTTLAPGERISISMNAPLYPSIETKYKQNTYGYTYLLYTPQSYMFTGKINVTINTPYYIVSDGTTEYTKTEDGYSLTTYDAYMIDRIDFTLCEVETPENIQISEWEAFLFLLIVAFYAVVIFAHVAFDTVSIVINEFFADLQNWFSNFINSIF